MDFLERTDSRPQMGWRGISLGLGGGALLFLLGLGAARARLPEWQLPELPSREAVVARFRQAAERLEWKIGSEPGVEIDDGLSSQHNPYAVFGAGGGDWIRARQRPVLIEVSATGHTAAAGALDLSARFGIDGRLWEVTFTRVGLGIMKPIWDTEFPDARDLLRGPGERFGPATRSAFLGTPFLSAELLGAPFPESVTWVEGRKGPSWTSARLPGALGQTMAGSGRSPALLRFGLLMVMLFGVIALSFVLAVRRRIDFVNASLVTAVAVVFSLVATGLMAGSGRGWFGVIAGTALSAACLFFAWSTGESWLRATGRGSSSAFDALRSGRVGRRVGRAVFWGLGVGAACAGWRLLAYSAATLVPGGVPEVGSVSLPLLRAGTTPLDYGLGLSGLALLGLAVGRHFASGRLAWCLSIGVGGVLALPVLWSLRPFPLTLALAFGTLALLNIAFERAGSLALAVAGVVSYLLPMGIFALQSPSWFGAGLWTSASLLAGLGVIGLVGAFRPEAIQETVAAPGFVRRLEEEERLKYETGMLARMQEGLLPQDLPRVEGWEFAARTIQAHEVGGDFYDFFHEPDGTLWVAAGDVAGHGISCSITHAMTKAALAALIRPGETPAAVLGEVDRVLRTLTTNRLFTALALVRLDPQTGRGLFANAGYPYPLQRAGREVTELESPGLPVGEGPARRYRDLALHVAPGNALVFCSDGLFEALCGNGEPYGFDRPRQVLAAAPSRSADDLLQALTADWHREVGEQAEDDTTLLVLRRRG